MVIFSCGYFLFEDVDEPYCILFSQPSYIVAMQISS